jgi:hypothetical protein
MLKWATSPRGSWVWRALLVIPPAAVGSLVAALWVPGTEMTALIASLALVPLSLVVGNDKLRKNIGLLAFSVGVAYGIAVIALSAIAQRPFIDADKIISEQVKCIGVNIPPGHGSEERETAIQLSYVLRELCPSPPALPR